MKFSPGRTMLCIRILLTISCAIYVVPGWTGFLHHQPVHTPVVLVATLAVTALIWLPDPTVRGWTWLAFLMLCFGCALVSLTGSGWTVIAICIMATASVRLWHLHRRQTSARIAVVGMHVYIPLAMKLGRSLGSLTGEDGQVVATPVQPVASATPITPSREQSACDRPAPTARVENPPQPSPARGVAAYDFSENVRRARHTFAAIVGMDQTKRRLLRAAQDVLEGNARARNGILLFGSPGNGKTLFAEALAGQLGVHLISIAYGDAASKWVNETPQKVKAVFSEAKKAGACAGLLTSVRSS